MARRPHWLWLTASWSGGLLGLTRHEWDEVRKYVGQWGQLQYDNNHTQQQHERDSRRTSKRRRDEVST